MRRGVIVQAGVEKDIWMRWLVVALALGAFAGPVQARMLVPAGAGLVAGAGPVHLAQSRKLIRGKRGGCYYINRNGNKTYVDRSLCRGK
jgi:hypothetical protein